MECDWRPSLGHVWLWAFGNILFEAFEEFQILDPNLFIWCENLILG